MGILMVRLWIKIPPVGGGIKRICRLGYLSMPMSQLTMAKARTQMTRPMRP